MQHLATEMSHPKYRPDVDGLRAVAVLLVVAYHAFPGRISGGFVGVDVFFVISGFLISTVIFENLGRGSFSFAEFYIRRVRRIFPALILILVSSLAFGWLALFPHEYKQLGKHTAASAGLFSNLVLWSEAGYFDNSAETKPLLHLWSLGVEEQFYIAWPFILWFSWRRRFSLLASTLIVTSISFGLNLYGIKQNSTATFYSPQTRFWELSIGGLLSWFTIRKKNGLATCGPKINSWLNLVSRNKPFEADGRRLSNVIACLSGLLLVYVSLRMPKAANFPGMWAVVPVACASLIILAGPNAWVNRKLLSNKLVVWFGLISYPLYLWHWPILSFARIVQGDVPQVGIRVAGLALAVLLAWGTRELFESPIRRNKGGAAGPAVLTILLVFVGLLGYGTYINNGFITRSSISGFVYNENDLVGLPETDDACLSYVGQETLLTEYCRFTSANSHQTIAVIGDSHAVAAYPGVSEYLHTRGMNTLLLANSGCPPFPESPTGKTKKNQVACKKRVDQLLKIVESKRDITKVFVLTRGPIYVTDTEPLFGDEKQNISNISMDQFVGSAQITFSRLATNGKSVYYVSENPELDFRPDACLERRFGPKAMKKNCTVSLESVYDRQAAYRNSFSNLGDVTYIDSISIFCPSTKCIAFDEMGVLLYADDDHLSIAGSRFLVKRLLAPFLESN